MNRHYEREAAKHGWPPSVSILPVSRAPSPPSCFVQPKVMPDYEIRHNLVLVGLWVATFITGFCVGFYCSNSLICAEYVFPNFASLSAWLRENIRHGKPEAFPQKIAP